MIMKKTKRSCNRVLGSKRCLSKIKEGTCPLEECRRVLITTKEERDERPSLKSNTLSGIFQKRRMAQRIGGPQL